MAEQNAAAANANANAGGEGAGAPDNKGTGDPSQKGEGQGAQFTVPKRNAEYWESAQKRREESRKARMDFFTSQKQKPKGEAGEGEGEGEVDELDKPLTRRELQRIRDEDKSAFEEQLESRTMAQADELAITRFVAGNPKFQKYERDARAILKDPAYSHADIGIIFRGLAYEDAAAEGASRGAKAGEKSRRDSTTGTGQKPQSGQTGYDPSKHKEFKQQLRQGKAKFSPEE